MKSIGALPMQRIRALMDADFLTGATSEHINPGSLDLTPTNQFFRVRGAFLPNPNETVEDALKRVGAIPVAEGSVLERGGCYVCKLSERIVHMPEGLYAYANPKSSSGRVDLYVRMLADKVSRYDSVPRGYKGDLWLLIAPKTFSVFTPVGVPLNQLRLFNHDTRLDQLQLETCFAQDGGFLYRPDGSMISYPELQHSDRDGSVILTLGLDFEFPGFEAVMGSEPIDLSLKGHYDPKFFFRPISVPDNALFLNANTFYILSTKERVRVPVNYACEMAPMDERSGDFRSHYAGFIDPGWGVGNGGESNGRPLTLEVRSFDNGIVILNGQPIAKVKYEEMIEVPDSHYDTFAPNYGDQSGPRLSKHFLPWGK